MDPPRARVMHSSPTYRSLSSDNKSCLGTGASIVVNSSISGLTSSNASLLSSSFESCISIIHVIYLIRHCIVPLTTNLETNISARSEVETCSTYQRFLAPFAEGTWSINNPSITSKASNLRALSSCRSLLDSSRSLILVSMEASTPPNAFRTISKPVAILQSLRTKHFMAPCIKWRYVRCGGLSFQDADTVCNPMLICLAEKSSKHFLNKPESVRR